VVGNGWSIAWRVYDAQYWGVPQRRKRIYLVADFASERAGEILFEREGVSGDSSESGTAGKGIAADTERSVGRSSLFEPMSLMEENWSEQTVKNALRANASKSGHCIVQDGVKCLNPWDCQSKRQHDVTGCYPTLQAYNGGGGRCDGVVYPINTMVATRGGKDDMRTCFGIGEPGDPQFTISAAHEHGVCYALQGNGIDRADTAGCNGKGWREDKMYTLNTIDRPAIAFDCRNNVSNEEVSGTLQAKSTGGYSLNYQNPVCYRNGGYGGMVEGVGTFRANGGDVGPGSENIVVEKHE
jgi:DNA (cytosine-5)-methyltransferase 1